MSSIILKGPGGGNVRMLVDPELTEDEEMILPFNSVPLFGIIMYFGVMSDLDAEVWALCDGTNGTPDLRNQFVRGGDGTNIGVAGGSNDAVVVSHTHTSPVHSHSINQHNHSGAAHTHAGPAHTHTGPSHTHTSAAHHHAANHNHNGHTSSHYVYSIETTYTTGLAPGYMAAVDSWSGYVFTGDGYAGGGQAGIGIRIGGGTGVTIDTVTFNTSDTTPAATGYGGTGSTGSSGTQATGGASSANTGETSLETNQGGATSDPNVGDTGVAGTNLNMPAFITLVYIMRMK